MSVADGHAYECKDEEAVARCADAAGEVESNKSKDESENELREHTD